MPMGQKEALINSDMSKPKMDWDTIWDVKSKIDDLGWTAEFAIPFSIPSDAKSDTWRIDFGRWFSRSGAFQMGWVLVTEIGSLSRMPEKLAVE